MNFKNILTWLSDYSQLKSWLYFNATPFISGTTALNSVSGDRVLRKYIDGSKDVELVFAIDMVEPYDTGTSDVNVDAIEEVINFSDWIEEKMALRDFPTLDDNCSVTKIEILNNIPDMLVSEDQALAKYQFQVKITYKDKKEVI